MKILIKEIRSICEKILIKKGVKFSAAKIIINDYLEGELLGKKSHGLFAFAGGVYDIDDIVKKSNPNKIIVEKNFGPTALVNGHEQAGQLVAEVAKKILIKKCKKYGIAMVGTYNSRPFLRPGSQAESIAHNNLVALIFQNGGGPLVAPYGGIDPIISTNPIGYAIPTLSGPIVLDMAVSVKAWGETRIAKESKTLLPDNAFLDKKGKITLNPYQVYSVMPFGGYKGFSIGILSEIFTGSLVGNGVGLKKKGLKPGGHGKALRGALFIAIDPNKFTNLKKFKKENSELVKELKKSRKRPGVKGIFMPEERSYKNKIKCLKRGWLEVDKKIIDKIYQLKK